MKITKPLIEFARRYWLQILAVIVLIVAFSCALWINFEIRASVEAQDRTVGLLIDYDELKRIADASHNIEFFDMARKARLSGATGLVVRERTLVDWETAGDILMISGGNLLFQIESERGEFSGQWIDGKTIAPEKTYILTKDDLVYEQIFQSLETKRRYPESFELSGYSGIVTHLHSAERASLGMGFPIQQLGEAAEEGLIIIPRLRNWEPVSRVSIAESFRWVEKIPNLAAVGFNEQNLLGDVSNPILLELPEFVNYLDALVDNVAPLGVPLVSFELYDQAGLATLAARLDNNLIRAHAISDNELYKYFSFQDAIDRYSLAATERNIRYIYVRFYGLMNPAASMERNMELLTEVRQALVDEGLAIGHPETIQVDAVPILPMFLLGTGIMVVWGWLIALALERFFSKKWRLPYAILLLFGFIAWAGLLMIMPLLARKIMALMGSIGFPSLAAVLVLESLRDKFKTWPRLIRAVALFGVMSAITLIGAMVVSAMLAEQRFMIRLDSFYGVTLSNVVPLALVPCILWLR